MGALGDSEADPYTELSLATTTPPQVGIPWVPEEGQSLSGHGHLQYMNSECTMDSLSKKSFKKNYANVEIQRGRENSVNSKPLTPPPKTMQLKSSIEAQPFLSLSGCVFAWFERSQRASGILVMLENCQGRRRSSDFCCVLPVQLFGVAKIDIYQGDVMAFNYAGLNPGFECIPFAQPFSIFHSRVYGSCKVEGFRSRV